jgi:hypothetical protein
MLAPERKKSAMGKLEDLDNLFAGRPVPVGPSGLRWFARTE